MDLGIGVEAIVIVIHGREMSTVVDRMLAHNISITSGGSARWSSIVRVNCKRPCLHIAEVSCEAWSACPAFFPIKV